MSEAHSHLHSGLSPLVAAFALVIVALVYLRGWFRLRKTFTHLMPYWRLAAFMAGLLAVWMVVGSPLAKLDHQSLTMHMVKHLLLMTVAAPLLLVGEPALSLLRGLPRRLVQNDLDLGTQTARWLGSRVAHPVFCWMAATATVIGWHLPAAFQLAMQLHWVHCVENASFLFAGLLFWWPVVQPLPSVSRAPRWSMALYLFLATLPCDILSAFLAFCGRVTYPSYLSAPQLFNMSPLQDQECAGALMWFVVTFAYLLPAIIITVQILSPSSAHSRQEASDASRTLRPTSLNGSEAEVA